MTRRPRRDQGLEPGEIADKDRIGPQHLAHRQKRVRRVERPERPAGAVDQLVQHEAAAAQEALHVAEQRLVLVERHELHLAFDHQRVRNRRRAVPHDLELVTLRVDLDEIGPHLGLDVVEPLGLHRLGFDHMEVSAGVGAADGHEHVDDLGVGRQQR
jgi:hypothetical protein